VQNNISKPPHTVCFIGLPFQNTFAFSTKQHNTTFAIDTKQQHKYKQQRTTRTEQPSNHDQSIILIVRWTDEHAQAHQNLHPSPERAG